MMAIDPGSISALERGDIKRYPNEIDKVPQRGAAVSAAIRPARYAEVAAEIRAEPAPAKTPEQSEKAFSLWEKASFSFNDVLDIINPLQHIPIVATLYRNMSGDQIGMAPRVIGGALWGRIGGFVTGVVNAVVSWFTGKDIGDHVYAALFGKPGESAGGVAVASAPPIPAAPPERFVADSQAVALPQTIPQTEKTSAGETVAEPATIESPKTPLTLSSPSLPPALAAAGRPVIYPYLRAPKRDESEDDAPRMRMTV